MKSRMEKYYKVDESSARTIKNKALYTEMDKPLIPRTKVSLLDNEVDITNVKDIIDNRSDYLRAKKYHNLVGDDKEGLKEEHSMYNDIENRVYDINDILEMAKSKQPETEQVKRRKLQNTQYNILSNLEFKAKNEELEEKMVDDFFTKDTDLTSLVEDIKNEKGDTTNDLFKALKPTDDTVLTRPVTRSDLKDLQLKEKEDNTFYTDVMSFTKNNFDHLENLESTVKTNNKLIKVLITILIGLLFIIAGYVVITFY